MTVMRVLAPCFGLVTEALVLAVVRRTAADEALPAETFTLEGLAELDFAALPAADLADRDFVDRPEPEAAFFTA